MLPQGNDTINLALHSHASLPQEENTNASWMDQRAVIFILGQDQIYRVLPEGQEMLVGRKHSTNGPQPDLDLSPYGAAFAGTSRLHVALEHDQDSWWLIDMNSSNGTWVDGERLAPFVPHMLSNTNHIFLSNFELFIMLPEGE